MKRDCIDFQERSRPLAYLITFRCYGTWLHGDERGSMDRKRFNSYGNPKITPNELRVEFDRSLLKNAPQTLNSEQRNIVEEAIWEVCNYRRFSLFALQARTNHVHVVVSGVGKPELIMNSFKSYATRNLRKNSLILSEQKVWSRHGSTKYLWTERHIEIAVDYVLNGQGGELPNFD
jgi:REP element-mobilizing transposase RayT